MQNTPPTPEDDELALPEQDTDSDAPRSLSPLSATRASRIRRGSRISGAIPGRDPLPGIAPAPQVGQPDASAAPRRKQPIPPPRGPRTYAHLLAGLCYLAPPIVPAIVLFIPTRQSFARFHALQALALFVIAVTLSALFSFFTPTNIVLDILYILLVVAAIALLLLWIAAAIAAFEGFAVALPLLDRLIPRTANLEEDLAMRGSNPRSTLEVAIAAVASVGLLVLTIWWPLSGWFGKLNHSTLAALGLTNGLPVWIVVSSLLFSLIFAGIGLTTGAVLILGLYKSKFLPTLASGSAVAGSALTAAGTGLLIADTLQRSMYSKLEQQFQNMVRSAPVSISSSNSPTGFARIILNGRNTLSAIDPSQHSLLIPGALLLLLGLGILLFLLSQLYYKR